MMPEEADGSGNDREARMNSDKLVNVLGIMIILFFAGALLANFSYFSGYQRGKRAGYRQAKIQEQVKQMDEVLAPDRFSEHYQDIIKK